MSVVARHLAALFWRNALAAAAAVTVLGLGLSRALAHAGQRLDWSDSIAELARALPWIAPLVAVAATCAELERERSLVALVASGRSLRCVGSLLFLAGAPCAVLAVAVGALAKPSDANELAVARLRDGALLVRAADGSATRVGGIDERSLERGRIEASAQGERLVVAARWDARELGLDDREAPSAAIPIELAPRPELESMLRVRDALRPLVLLALAIGLWLRPFGRGFPARLCAGLALALGYLALELFLACASAAGELSSGLGAFGAALTFGALGVVRWWRADRPSGVPFTVPR